MIVSDDQANKRNLKIPVFKWAPRKILQRKKTFTGYCVVLSFYRWVHQHSDLVRKITTHNFQTINDCRQYWCRLKFINSFSFHENRYRLKIRELRSNSSRFRYITLSANILGKGIESIFTFHYQLWVK